MPVTRPPTPTKPQPKVVEKNEWKPLHPRVAYLQRFDKE